MRPCLKQAKKNALYGLGFKDQLCLQVIPMCSMNDSPLFHGGILECTTLYSLWFGMYEDRGRDIVTGWEKGHLWPLLVSQLEKRSQKARNMDA